jgi:pyruvate dehydrogenase (quinone)
MSQTVAGSLVEAPKDGVRQILGLIADSLNPIGDGVSQSKIEWIGVRRDEGAAWLPARQS